ncbi:MAG: sortase [Candidatus Saccharibacteria bacterium]|nr:sortase [Candidatus Saccharibacteria bacterium]
MKPTDTPSDNRLVTPPQQGRPFAVPARDSSASQQAAAEVIRGQINAIYSGGSTEATPHTTPQPEPVPTVQPEAAAHHTANRQPAAASAAQTPAPHAMRTAPPAAQAASPQPAASSSAVSPTPARRPQATPEEWQQYHSAWQSYYQQYYERYYIHHLNAKRQELSQFLEHQPAPAPAADSSLSEQQAINEMRAKIRQTVRQSTQKLKRSRHFVPVVAGLVVMALFLVIQFNRQIIGSIHAYASPGNIDPQSIITDPTVNIDVGPEPRILIPKINVDAPVIYGVGPDEASQDKAMEKGVAHFSIPGANAVPGQVGNTVLAGHSSNDAFVAGAYKFIFARNEKLVKDDIIYLNYQSKRYVYKITAMEVVLPHEVGKVQLSTTKPMLTLVSCVPLGRSDKRLLVFAEQISPDPQTASNATADTGAPSSSHIPGNPAPSLIERLFGA